MIIKKDIKQLITELDSYYNSTSHPRSTHYSKLAVMELCGWIEESFDKVAKRCVNGKIKTTVYQNIMNDIISKNFGFKYNSNFRRMMLQTIGLPKMEKLEMSLSATGEKVILDSVLNGLITERNRAAHTTTAGTMTTYQAPSITLNQLETIYPIIRKIYTFAVQEI
jgi:hypothetical protein